MIVGRRGYWHFWAILPLAAAGLALPGCSASRDDLPRQPVAGTVLVDGKALTYGDDHVLPGSPGHPRRAGLIRSGDRQGIVLDPARQRAGARYVHDLDFRRETAETEGADRTRTQADTVISRAEEHIPAKFNSKSELEVEVKEGGIKDLRIEIESK